ncbi:BamA/TamA family outer membrane protein [Pontibacter sp. JH31]|uniref:BamA/TamA family outer membrane protein n=1 Tax=Pontibacter aquaedesilientis TaxID=2766980 RepID=A0ABR7XHG9_9BACT|nr:BamA/TamA family outer membrane protein [Pontibacter aquaedesilientis]MBD1397078.1 BamA/TamA family outer membrane protein [Pontibacter aquaedesilientis]
MRLYLYITFLLLSVMVLNATPLLAQEQTTEEETSNPPQAEMRSVKGLIPAPVIYYTPDTRLGFGASLLGYFRLRSYTDTTYTRLSLARLVVDYTLNKQTDQWLYWNIFTREERLLLRGELRHRIYTDRFYGIGNNTPKGDRELYDYDMVSAKIAVLKNVGFRSFLGPDLQLTEYYDVELEEGSQLLSKQIPGYKTGRNMGLGAIFLIDHRDNTAYPSKGFYLELSGYHFGKAFGSDFRYNNFNFEFNRYFGLGNNRVLATNTMLKLNDGDVPVQRLATAGGDKILRGYARNRFQDDNFVGSQVEYRFPLFWRLGMATFAGIGDVFGKPSDISLSTVKYSVGTGLRYAIRPEQKLNSRLDVGYGREGFNVYLMIGEAF